MRDLATTLAELVDTPSETGNEGRICTAVSARLLESRSQSEVRRAGNSLLVGARAGRPLLLLVGHLDTVPAQGQGPARVEGGRLYGLGASDMKAGLAVMIHLLEDPTVRVGPYDVVGVFYEREEGAADENGLEPLLQHADWLAEAEFAVVLEPSDLELQLGCTGVINAIVRFRGKAAHSARPWLGENAITKAGAWLAALHDREPQVVAIQDLEFREVVSVTTAHGGVARNVIPANFEVNVNYRFAPDKTLADAEAALRRMVEDADEVEIVDRAPAAPVPEDNPHLERLARFTGAERTAKQAWTDVARLGQYGIPAVNYGPGETAQAHRAGESVSLENLERAFSGLRHFLS